ncbi:MAG: CD225/dispanin family protein [Xanthomonadaceae bacterium]|nr:CD225/dispanin family protein [Xanthomonadaceae bacterium]
MNTSQDVVPNNLVWAILATLFCCLPLGIVSIVYAAKVDGLRAAGDLAGAWDASRKAKTWALWSALSGPVLIIIWFMFFGGLAMLGAMTGNH